MTGGGDEPASEAFWVSARERYERAREPVSAIAAGLGLSAQALTIRARALGWKLRGSGKKKATGTRETFARLKALLQQRLVELERQIGALGEGAAAASSERDIRSMNTLVRTLEKVLELERKERAQRKQQRKRQHQFDDAEREALAAKLDGLRRELRQRRADQAAEQPECEASQP